MSHQGIHSESVLRCNQRVHCPTTSYREYPLYTLRGNQCVHSRSVANNLSSPMRVCGKQVENFPTLTMGISCKQPAFTGIYPSTCTLVENNYSSLKNATIRCWTTIPYTTYYRFSNYLATHYKCVHRMSHQFITLPAIKKCINCCFSLSTI